MKFRIPKKFKYELFENGLDFIYSAFKYFINHKEKCDLKYSLLHLQAGFELILKSKLEKEHWAFIFNKLDQATIENYKSGNFQSIYFDECIKRLENICDIEFSK